MMESDRVLDPVQQVGRHWGWMLLYGMVLTALGVFALVQPKETSGIVVGIFGFAMLLAGIFDIVGAIADDSGDRWARAIVGIVAILLGLILLRHIHGTVAVVGLILGVFWLVRGVVMVISGVTQRNLPGRGWRIAGGLIFTVLGAYVLGYPSTGPALVIWIFGFLFVLAGLLEIAVAFAVKGETKSAA